MTAEFHWPSQGRSEVDLRALVVTAMPLLVYSASSCTAAANAAPRSA